jgi:hypothetical protein
VPLIQAVDCAIAHCPASHRNTKIAGGVFLATLKTLPVSSTDNEYPPLHTEPQKRAKVGFFGVKPGPDAGADLRQGRACAKQGDEIPGSRDGDDRA